MPDAVSSSASIFRDDSITDAPLSASARAIAAPIPLDAPVTRAAFPLRSMVVATAVTLPHFTP